MISPVNNNLTGLVFESQSDKIELEQSLAKLSSGNKLIRAGDDTGAFSQASKLGSKNKRDLVSLQNLQNLVSYSQTQDGVLEKAGKILHRMNEITVRALDVTATNADRENYNKEFLELAEQLDQMSIEKFGGLNLFGEGAFSQDKQDFIEALQKQWLKGAMNIIEQRYGLSPEGSDSFKVIVNENDTGGHTAFVSFAGRDVIEMQFDLPDFQSPFTTSSSDSPIFRADRVVAHEMTHAVMADVLDLNTSVDGTVGGGSANWFIEGTAEFIHGADYRVVADLGGVINLDANQSPGNDIAFNNAVAQQAKVDANGAALINAIGDGTEGWSASPQYSAGYIATRYLHEELKTNGQDASAGNAAATNGIKDMLVWMKAKNESVGGALKNFLATQYTGTKKQAHDDFINNFKANGELFLRNTMDLTNSDTGAISGADADGGGIISPTEAVPNTGVGFVPDATAQTQPITTTLGGNAGFTLTWDEDNSALSASVDGTGATYDLQGVYSIQVSDTGIYNLNSISSARATLSELSTLMTNLSTERANVGANQSRLEKEIQNLNGKIITGEMAVGRIQDTDVAKESTTFASSQVRMQASIAILAQAKDLNVGIRDLIRGIMIGQS
jgi:flagellin